MLDLTFDQSDSISCSTADVTAQTSFEDLPSELRLRVYGYIFAGTEVHVRDYGYRRQGVRRVGKVRNAGILHVNKKIREEAYPVLEKQMTLVLYGQFGPREAAKRFPRARTLQSNFSCLDQKEEEDHYVESLQQYFPFARTIIYKVQPQFVSEWWKPLGEVTSWDEVISIISGNEDHVLADRFRQQLLELGARKFYPDAFPLYEQPTTNGQRCKVIYEITSLSFEAEDDLIRSKLEFRYVSPPLHYQIEARLMMEKEFRY